MKEFSNVLGRLLLALIFLFSGLNKIANWNMTLSYMNAQGIFLAPFFLFWAMAIEILCSLAIMTGYRARGAAIMLFLYLIPVTLVFHHFWNLSGMDRQMQFVNFLKNISIMGGLLGVYAFGPGPISMERERTSPLREKHAA